MAKGTNRRNRTSTPLSFGQASLLIVAVAGGLVGIATNGLPHVEPTSAESPEIGQTQQAFATEILRIITDWLEEDRENLDLPEDREPWDPDEDPWW